LREAVPDSGKEIMESVIVKSKKEQMPLKIVFVRSRNNSDVRSFGAVFDECKQELQEIHLNIAPDTLINTFTGHVKVLRYRKLLKKGCYEKALSLAREMISGWFTKQIAHVQDFFTRLREDLFPQRIRAN
jgi:hypothetical protein